MKQILSWRSYLRGPSLWGMNVLDKACKRGNEHPYVSCDLRSWLLYSLIYTISNVLLLCRVIWCSTMWPNRIHYDTMNLIQHSIGNSTYTWYECVRGKPQKITCIFYQTRWVLDDRGPLTFHRSIDLSIYVSIFLSIYLSIYLSLSLSIDRSIYLSMYLSIYRSIDLSIYRSIDVSIYRSIDLAIYRSIDLSIYRSIDLSIYRSIYLSFYLSIYLSISLSLSIYLSIDRSIYLSLSLSIYLSIDRLIYLSIYLFWCEDPVKIPWQANQDFGLQPGDVIFFDQPAWEPRANEANEWQGRVTVRWILECQKIKVFCFNK